ncbi:hypothetical protein LRS05_02715 [Flavobacterium sp. J372]|uniref:hypothetical protein n=1 Tax=Flavobacterium sp. J372 TaxID=2898436 RepID=UPI002151DCBF|nr:hypothetical protein [Flavobacterium sp. J372]MCR5861123.1 hypothetical protein [Flavobacterium sp. J372]
MKNLILGAIMLTGAVAFAQEPAKQTQQTQSSTTTTTTTPANQSQPAQQPQKLMPELHSRLQLSAGLKQ